MVGNLKYATQLPLVLLAVSSAAVGQGADFSGTYSLTADRDERLELVLLQDANGGVQGTLTGPSGTFEINAYVDGDVVIGTMHVDRQPVDFRAWLDGTHLVLSLGNAPAGRLAYLPTTDLLFTKEFADPYDYGTRPLPGRDPLQNRDPHGSGNPLAPFGTDATLSFAGTFSDGHVVLELRGGGSSFTGHLTIDGRDYPVQARVTDGVLTGTFSNRLEEYQIVGTRDIYGLTLESGGQSYYLRYQEDFGPGSSGASRALPGRGIVPGGERALSDGSAAGMRWAEFLRGSRVIRSIQGNSPDIDFILCRDGRYIGSGLPDLRRGSPSIPLTGSDGTWRVVAPMGIAYLELRTQRGQVRRYELTRDRAQLLLDGYPVSLETASVNC
jgi:hypothetical protein